MVPGHMGLQHFLQASGQKLGIQGRKAFLQDGGEIDDLQLVRDGDQVYISAGEAFHLARTCTRADSCIHMVVSLYSSYLHRCFVLDSLPRRAKLYVGYPCLSSRHAEKKANGQKFSQYSIAVMGPGSVGKSGVWWCLCSMLSAVLVCTFHSRCVVICLVYGNQP